MAGETVFVVVDPKFGNKVAALAKVGPVWALKSDTNERAIRELWSDPTLPSDHATFFSPRSDQVGEQACIYILDTVDQHHPGWAKMRVYGSALTDVIRAEFASAWQGSIEEAEDGFIFVRTAAAS
jgi:hypothetical protein